MALHIVAAGEIYIDQVLAGFTSWPQPGEEAFASSLVKEVGGGAPHTAAGLARLGRDVALVGPIGNDPWARARLEQLGVKTDRLWQHTSEPTGTTIAVSMPGERTFFTYRGANVAVEAALREVPRADHLHLGVACSAELLTWLCRRAKTISIDAGWHPHWLRDDAVKQALRAVTWFMPNEIEAAALTGESDPTEMLRQFEALQIRAVVKLGAAGSATIVNGKYRQVDSIPIDPVDTTGAGDCFDAGFLDAWLSGEDLETCLASGNICGALSTRKMGGMNGFPTREEMNEWRSKSR